MFTKRSIMKGPNFANPIPFTFVLFLLAPELKKLPTNSVSEIIEQARQSSQSRLKVYFGRFFFASLALPFVLLLMLFYWLGLLEGGNIFFAIPLLAVLTSLCFSLSLSVFTSLALIPEIRRRLP
jgi:hypothetical protein